MLTAEVLGYAPTDRPTSVSIARSRERRRNGRDAILLHATARPEKEWPVARWIAACARASARGFSPLLPWGTEAERQRSDEIAGAVPGARAPDYQPLERVARMIARAAFVVGVDTGLLHLAAALGVPLVAIFVGTEPGQHGPVGAGADRCRRRSRAKCRRSPMCMAAIERVAKRA